MATVVIVVVMLALLGIPMMFSNRAQKKRQEQIDKTLNALKPGNKVKTIGGICGIVAEICPEDNTFILETGSENSGKSYIKFDKQAIYQTDAVVEEEAPVEEAPAEETPVEEAPVEEAPFEEIQEQTDDEKEE